MVAGDGGLAVSTQHGDNPAVGASGDTRTRYPTSLLITALLACLALCMMLFRKRKLNEAIADLQAERDRYKEMAEWLAQRAGIGVTYGPKRPFMHPEDWLKAAEEATRE